MSSSSFLESSPNVDPVLIETIVREMAEVESALCEQMSSEVPAVEEVAMHTLQAGGKRLRPALVTLSALACRSEVDTSRTRALGSCMEMIHMATLIHDDVIDQSDLRRGRPTAARLFGSTQSILSGDVLLAKAMRLLALDGDLEIIRTVSSVVVDLAEGEVLELGLRNQLGITREQHFEVLQKKTATFLGACCEVGGLCAGATESERKALRSFGVELGFAFQIIDDLLDYREKNPKFGKPRATDLREGCVTMPLLLLLPKLSAEERNKIVGWFGDTVSDVEIETICQWMDERGVFGETLALARKHIDTAISQTGSLQPEPAKILAAAAEFVFSRTH